MAVTEQTPAASLGFLFLSGASFAANVVEEVLGRGRSLLHQNHLLVQIIPVQQGHGC